MTALLDGNLLVALADPDHQHHHAARRWLAEQKGRIASCPITQGTLLRLRIRAGVTAAQAAQHLAAIMTDSRHEFWPDSFSYADVPLGHVVGHRQVTDAYLVQLARSRGGTLATFDRGLATGHPDVAELVPLRGPEPPDA